MKTTWEKLNELRKYVLSLDINASTDFKTIGSLRFYRSGDFVSIDETLAEPTGNKIFSWDLHSTSALSNIQAVSSKAQTYEEALRELNVKWEQLDRTDAFVKKVYKTLAPFESQLKMDVEAVKIKRIEKLKAEIADLEK